MKNLVLVIILISLFGCDSNNIPTGLPVCVKDLIKDGQSNPKEVWRYFYKDEFVYLVIPDCCDQYISLYSSKCNLICAPSGGITGGGDGKCPGFYQEAEDGELLWKSED